MNSNATMRHMTVIFCCIKLLLAYSSLLTKPEKTENEYVGLAVSTDLVLFSLDANFAFLLLSRWILSNASISLAL